MGTDRYLKQKRVNQGNPGRMETLGATAVVLEMMWAQTEVVAVMGDRKRWVGLKLSRSLTE